MGGTIELSRREREVAKLVAEGLTNRQVADRLFIAERTAEGHVEQIRNKLGFTSRSQIAAWVAAGAGAQPARPVEGRRRDNLPKPPGDLVGRKKEIYELVELVARRRGVVTRHRALAATFAWSHELLTAEERRLWATSAVPPESGAGCNSWPLRVRFQDVIWVGASSCCAMQNSAGPSVPGALRRNVLSS